ncbi:MAG: acetolactate synthase large subunit [Patescibacteria group bacterium]
MNVSELIVKVLENEGVDTIFGIPGEENVTFIEALYKSHIRYVQTADERGAAFMAASYGRLKGKPGVVFTTLGPGALNIPNGVSFANMAGIPLIALTWQRGIIQSNKDNGFMYVDIKKVLKSMVKYQRTISSSKNVISTIQKSFLIAGTPRAGSCHIEIPEDIGKQKVTNEIKLKKPVVLKSQKVNVQDILEAVKIISSSKNPIILVGFSASNDKVAQLIRKFAQKAGIHVITTPMAQGMLPSNHSLSLYSLIHSCDTLLQKYLNEVDTIISIGYNPIEFSPRFFNNDKLKNIIHINSVNAKVHPNYTPQIEIIGKINEILELLIARVNKREISSIILSELKEKLIETRNPDYAYPIKPEYLVNMLKKVSNNAIIVHDNGMHKLWVTKFFRPDNPNQIILDNALASMGSGVPNGIVTKLMYPKKDVIVNTGEGGLLMCLGEISTAISLNTAIVILVWRDGGYGMINWHQQANNLHSFGVSVKSPDFVKFIESFGGVGYRINNAEELEGVLSKALNNNKLTIIDCPVDYSENIKVFNKKNDEDN